MWYTVAKREFGNTMVGAIFKAEKTRNGMVKVTKVKFTNEPVTMKATTVLDIYTTFTMTASAARVRFTKPRKELGDVIEESIGLSEGAYC
jgi:hypothetical protein